jgi:hypothetical protein
VVATIRGVTTKGHDVCDSRSEAVRNLFFHLLVMTLEQLSIFTALCHSFVERSVCIAQVQTLYDASHLQVRVLAASAELSRKQAAMNKGFCLLVWLAPSRGVDLCARHDFELRWLNASIA